MGNSISPQPPATQGEDDFESIANQYENERLDAMKQAITEAGSQYDRQRSDVENKIENRIDQDFRRLVNASSN